MDLLSCVVLTLIIALIIRAITKSLKSNEKVLSEMQEPIIQEPIIEESVNEYQEMPYEKKKLLTFTEYSFYKILKSKCDAANLLICPKVRLEDIANVTSKENIQKWRGYIKSRHVDFLICDENLKIMAAIELDDYSHNNQKAQKTDEFKNNLFSKIGIPLLRIKTGSKYDEEIDNVIYYIKS